MWEGMKIMMSNIWNFVLPFLRQLMTKAGPILTAAAMEAVKVAVGKNGAAKREDAYKRIVSDLEVQGIRVGTEVGSSLIYAAIEVAVQATKAE